ncbi:hypothetical protein [Flavobacterium hungaricum]|uniref:DUF4306 domain-containing protein n=1 Tax=Flavobacterium hungaricum TaxID=2082725 RepID=A0ABR9TE77_9FLAO|nr:hypothetical protein [Flavobacterium hungaricum]MBE8723357.1 hypothetical protein [Flavobacterium hungaricum]
MRKNIFLFLTTAIIYLAATFLYSLFFGLAPFNNGQVIGYPAIYYQFWISETEKQFGFMKIENLLINLVIIFILTLLYKIAAKQKNEKTQNEK